MVLMFDKISLSVSCNCHLSANGYINLIDLIISNLPLGSRSNQFLEMVLALL